MSANHTPGPWRIAHEISMEGIWIESDNEHDKSSGENDEICHVSTATVSESEGNGNAHLIAAAPEMLEALKAAPKTNHPADNRGPCLCSSCEFSRRALGLIARAEGRAT